MAAGDNTANSIIWVPGEATGKNISGQTAALPVGRDSYTDTEIASAILVSGGVPTGAPTGSNLQLNSATRILYAWTGSAWVTVSGGL